MELRDGLRRYSVPFCTEYEMITYSWWGDGNLTDIRVSGRTFIRVFSISILMFGK